MSDPGPAAGAAGANLFRLPSVQIAIAIDAASTALSVALFVFTGNPLSFAPVVLAGAWLAVTLMRARRTAPSPSQVQAPSNDQIVQ